VRATWRPLEILGLSENPNRGEKEARQGLELLKSLCHTQRAWGNFLRFLLRWIRKPKTSNGRYVLYFKKEVLKWH